MRHIRTILFTLFFFAQVAPSAVESVYRHNGLFDGQHGTPAGRCGSGRSQPPRSALRCRRALSQRHDLRHQ